MSNVEKQAKYYKLKEYLKQEILMGRIKPGEQIPSENALAEKFSISRHTVRKAISILVNSGYLHSEHGRGTYCTDRSIKRNNSRNIGVITTYISEYIFPKVIQGIDSVLSKNGYSIILKSTNNDIANEYLCLEDMLEKNIEGLIIEPTKVPFILETSSFTKRLITIISLMYLSMAITRPWKINRMLFWMTAQGCMLLFNI